MSIRIERIKHKYEKKLNSLQGWWIDFQYSGWEAAGTQNIKELDNST